MWRAAVSPSRPLMMPLSRGSQVARTLLGETCGDIVATDRWSAYNWYPVRGRQRCWAHLLRDIAAMIGRGGRLQAIGEALESHAHQMCHWWQRVRDATLKRSSFRSYMSPVRREVERRLEASSTCGVAQTEMALTTRIALQIPRKKNRVPNARDELRPIAGATEKRRLLGVGCRVEPALHQKSGQQADFTDK